jgi:hypothetical protein
MSQIVFYSQKLGATQISCRMMYAVTNFSHFVLTNLNINEDFLIEKAAQK